MIEFAASSDHINPFSVTHENPARIVQAIRDCQGCLEEMGVVPEAVRPFYLLNPFASLLNLARSVLYEGRAPDLGLLADEDVNGGALEAGCGKLGHGDRSRHAYRRQ